MGISSAMQRAVVARLLEDTDYLAAVADTTDGPALFAVGQKFADRFPRTTIEKPQVQRRDMPCRGEGYEVFITLHHWAQGPGSSLECNDLADAARTVLDRDPRPEGFSVLSADRHFQAQREVGDPDQTVNHLVQTFRYLVNP